MKMKSETQALHLERMLQRHIRYPSYELTFSLVMVPKKKLKKLTVDDVVLCGFNRLDLLLIDGDEICANIQLEKAESSYKATVTNVSKETIKQYDSKKYEVLKTSFGILQSKRLEIGQTIDIRQIDFEKVRLVLKDKTIAEGSLVIVDQEIAIRIQKVN